MEIAMLHKYKSAILRDTRGVSALEFAFAAPVIISLILGSIEVGYQAVVRTTLESAVTSASREAITGATAISGKTRDEIIQLRVRDAMTNFSLIKVVTVNGDPTKGNPRINVRFYSSQTNGGGFANIGKDEVLKDYNGNGACDTGNVVDISDGSTKKERFSDSNGNNTWDKAGKSGAGGPGDIVAYNVEVDSPLLFGISLGMGNKSSNNTSEKDVFTLNSQMIVQNETFATAGANSNIQKYCDGTKV
jgi:hypothetical protein